MTDIISNDIQAYAMAAVHAAVVLAVLWFAAWATFWRGTTETLARLDAELQRHKYQVSAGEAEVRRLGALLRQFEERQTVEVRPVVTAVPRSQTSAYEMAIRMASSGATDSELVAACGMSREEAALMLRLHGSRSRSAA
jgi:hypothetical protein